MPSRQPPLLRLSSIQQTFPPRHPFRRIFLPDGNGSNREVISFVAVDLTGCRNCPRSWTQGGLVKPAPVGWVAGRNGRGCAESLAAGSPPRGRSLQRLPRAARRGRVNVAGAGRRGGRPRRDLFAHSL